MPIKGVDGTEIHEILVPKNTTIYVAMRAANLDLSLWGSDARVWRPERWFSPLPQSVSELPGAYSHA